MVENPDHRWLRFGSRDVSSAVRDGRVRANATLVRPLPISRRPMALKVDQGKRVPT